METEKKATEKNVELTTEKKLRNVRTCLYILIQMKRIHNLTPSLY